MGKKTRSQIKKDRAKREYLKYKQLVADPEFMKLCKEHKARKDKLEKIESQLEKIPPHSKRKERAGIEFLRNKRLNKQFESQLEKISSFPPHSKRTIIKPDDPQYPIYELRQEYSKVDKEKTKLENIMMDKYNLHIPINPLIKEWGLQDFSGTGSIFKDLEIVKDIPFEEPQWNPEIKDIEYSGYLRDDRYLMIEIDTWHKRENIIASLQNKLDCLKWLGIIQFKKRIHLSTEEERVKAKQLRDEGKSLKQIAFDLWPEEFKKREEAISKRENVDGEERNLYYQYVTRLVEEGKTLGQAYKEADKKFQLKGKTPINPLIIKAHYLLKK